MQPKVLIVEDDQSIRELVSLYLENSGYDPCQAGDGDEARKILVETHIHLAILDIVLPDTEGWEICREIRRTTPEMPVIFLSCKDESDDIIHGHDLGADDYVTKPFDPRILMAKVNAQLRRREQYAQINIDFPSAKETSESDQQLLEDLTPYEKQMLRLIAQGLSNKQIAERLNYSLGTVKVYNNRIYSKLNVNNRYEAILKASLLHQLD